MFKITLGNGKILDNINVSGTNFVSMSELSENDFADGLRNVKIEFTGKNEDFIQPPVSLGTHALLKLLYCKAMSDEPGYFFVLDEYSQQELSQLNLNSRLAYLEMLNDIDD